MVGLLIKIGKSYFHNGISRVKRNVIDIPESKKPLIQDEIVAQAASQLRWIKILAKHVIPVSNHLVVIAEQYIFASHYLAVWTYLHIIEVGNAGISYQLLQKEVGHIWIGVCLKVALGALAEIAV